MSELQTKHPYGMDEIVSYHDGELSPEAALAFEAHLETCESCRRGLRAAEAALGAFDAQYGGPPPLDMAEVQAAFRRGEAQARAARRRRWAVGAAVGAGVSTAAAAALLLWAPRPGPRGPELLEPEWFTHTLPGAGAGDDLAPGIPGKPRPFVPDVAPLSVQVARQGTVAEVNVGRAARDRYLAIAIVDAKGSIWIAHGGYRPVKAGETSFRLDLRAIEAKDLEVAVLAGGRPIDRKDLADPLRYLAGAHHFPHLASLGVRAAGVAAVPR
ncbi:MAG: zf-HC2 domain-containing protein [Myxococcales bacterium]